MRKLLMKLKRDERGISAMEYAVLAGILLVVIVAGVSWFSDDVTRLFGSAADTIGTAATNAENAAETPPARP